MNHLRANLWLLVLSVAICSMAYPTILLGVGWIAFRDKAEGSLIRDKNDDKVVIGSRLIAQPFSGDQYFQPRPSYASYNAAAAGGSNWGANNYLLRERVARQLGPIVKYRQGQQPVAPDIESWFQKDRFQGKRGIVAQWAAMHGNVATNWVKADKLNAAYVEDWQKSHVKEVEEWKKEHPENTDPKPEDLAVPFFTSFSKERPGTFPISVEHDAPGGKKEIIIEPVKEGSDIQGIFFDLWLHDHPKADLEPVPADMVMTSGSGLDPHITLKNALYQLDRVAAKCADEATPKRDAAKVRKEIETLLRQSVTAPLRGLVGVDLINVLDANLELRKRYESTSSSATATTANSEKEKPVTETSKTETSKTSKTESAVGENGSKGGPDLTKTTESASKSQNTAKNDEKVASSEPSKPEKTTGSVEKKPPPAEAEKPNKTAASGKETSTDKVPPAVEPGKSSAKQVAAKETPWKSGEKVEPSAEPTKPDSATVKFPSPSGEKKPAPPEPEPKVAQKEPPPAVKPSAPEPDKVPSVKAKPAAVEPSPSKSEEDMSIATIIVVVPEGAKVYFDGQPTQQTGKERTFVTPRLEPGKEFTYELKMEMTREGRVTAKTQRITVRAGQTTRVEIR